MKGLSPRNLRYMRDFSKAFPQFTLSALSMEFLQQAAAKSNVTSLTNYQLAQVPWSVHHVLLDRVKDIEQRVFYANLRNFRQFYLTYPNPDNCYALRSNLTWTHHRLIMRVENTDARDFYIRECESQIVGWVEHFAPISLNHRN